jgi:ABC-type nitrate/sulfonate/bicarbonate transport system ATPase subunit
MRKYGINKSTLLTLIKGIQKTEKNTTDKNAIETRDQGQDCV